MGYPSDTPAQGWRCDDAICRIYFAAAVIQAKLMRQATTSVHVDGGDVSGSMPAGGVVVVIALSSGG